MSKPGLAARTTATTVLTRVLDDGRGLDGLLSTEHGPSALKQLGDGDRALVRAIATSALRHKGEIDHALSKVLDRKTPKGARHLNHTLLAAAAQILFLHVPDSAAVDLAVSALQRDKRSKRFAPLANAVLRRLSREKETIFCDLSDQERAIMNMPAWLRKQTRKSFGRERLAAIAAQHMIEPVVDVSVKSDPEAWADRLGGKHLFGNTVRIERDGRINTWPGYDTGEWWIQDAAASLPVQLMGDVAGKTVLDVCAAPGGKTAQLASLGATVTALEISAPRLERLGQNLARLKLEAKTELADLLEWENDEQFDAVLLDAPCSSTGTIRRHPDVQWAKSAEIVEHLAKQQLAMITSAARFVKPGGLLVFSNCSLNRQEGEDIYATVLKRAPGLKASAINKDEVFGHEEFVTGQGTIRTLPSQLQLPDMPRRFSGLDGFFCARFEKTKNDS